MLTQRLVRVRVGTCTLSPRDFAAELKRRIALNSRDAIYLRAYV